MSDRRSVAFVLPSLAGGGAEKVMLTFARALDREKFVPSLVLLSDEGPLADQVAGDVPVTVLHRPRVRHARRALAAALREQAPDFAFSTMAHLNFGLLSVRKALAPKTRILVREANTPSRLARGGIRGLLYRRGYKSLYRHAHRVIVPALFIGKELRRDFGVPDEKVRVLYNPVDEARLRDEAARAPVPAPDGTGPHFVAAGRLTEQKGFSRLLDWFAAARPDATLAIYGDGPDRPALEAKIAALGLSGRVRLPGFVQPLAPHIAAADAFLLPSLWEGMPNTALEALALGTPVIGTPEAGGLPEIRRLAGLPAVRIASGPAFVDAMNVIGAGSRGDSATALRDSLLPDAFRLGKVMAGLEAVLSA